MRILFEYGEAWRNYLFANCNGEHNDVKDFFIRVGLISDSHKQLVETMLEDVPGMEMVNECKEEIAFQRTQLEGIVKEFVSYYYENVPTHEELTADDILNDLCRQGNDNDLYKIAMEWRMWGEKVQKIWDNLNNHFGCGLYYLRDDLCELIMKEVYEN